jgi:hypothetical protein
MREAGGKERKGGDGAKKEEEKTRTLACDPYKP